MSHKAVASIVFLGLLCVVATGCLSSNSEEKGGESTGPRTVKAIHPVKQNLTRLVVQPGYIKPYEVAPIFTKIAGYALDVRVDIDDRVKKDEVLCKIWVPEVEKELKTKESRIDQARAEVKHAQEAMNAAKANVQTSAAKVQEVVANVLRAESDMQRWEAEYVRGKKLKETGVFDVQTVDEIINQRDSSRAMVAEVKAKKAYAEAALSESQANKAKADAEVETAKARLAVAQSDYDEWVAWLGYSTIRAPFDGKITVRNVHTGHFLQPSNSGSTSKQAEPLFVVVREDVMRITVQVPEYDSPLIKIGSEATIRFQALKNRDYVGKVTRTSYALDNAARTLLVEIHLKNPTGELRPGMYANVIIKAHVPDTYALPTEAILNDGAQDYCFCVENGKAKRMPLKTGVRTARMVEVLKKQMSETQAGEDVPWLPIDGSAQVVVTNPSSLMDGQEVAIEKTKPG